MGIFYFSKLGIGLSVAVALPFCVSVPLAAQDEDAFWLGDERSDQATSIDNADFIAALPPVVGRFDGQGRKQGVHVIQDEFATYRQYIWYFNDHPDGASIRFWADGEVEVLEARGALFVESEQLPLHAAAWIGDPDLVNFMVARGDDVNERNKWGYTALFPAHGKIWSGAELDEDRIGVIALLLAHGADPEITDRSGRTPGEWYDYGVGISRRYKQEMADLERRQAEQEREQKLYQARMAAEERARKAERSRRVWANVGRSLSQAVGTVASAAAENRAQQRRFEREQERWRAQQGAANSSANDAASGSNSAGGQTYGSSNSMALAQQQVEAQRASLRAEAVKKVAAEKHARRQASGVSSAGSQSGRSADSGEQTATSGDTGYMQHFAEIFLCSADFGSGNKSYFIHWTTTPYSFSTFVTYDAPSSGTQEWHRIREQIVADLDAQYRRAHGEGDHMPKDGPCSTFKGFGTDDRQDKSFDDMMREARERARDHVAMQKRDMEEYFARNPHAKQKLNRDFYLHDTGRHYQGEQR